MPYLSFVPNPPLVVNMKKDGTSITSSLSEERRLSAQKHRMYCEPFAVSTALCQLWKQDRPNALTNLLKTYGYCKNGRACPDSHNLDVILDCEENGLLVKRSKKPKKSQTKTSNTSDFTNEKSSSSIVDPYDILAEDGDCITTNGHEVTESPAAHKPAAEGNGLVMNDTNDTRAVGPLQAPSSPSKQLPATTSVFEVYHSATFDAYMTGCVFARQHLHHSLNSANGIKEHMNKINIMGKDKPLLIQVSPYAKPSKRHREMVGRLNGGKPSM